MRFARAGMAVLEKTSSRVDGMRLNDGLEPGDSEGWKM